jgi:hypothetical protein
MLPAIGKPKRAKGNDRTAGRSGPDKTPEEGLPNIPDYKARVAQDIGREWSVALPTGISASIRLLTRWPLERRGEDTWIAKPQGDPGQDSEYDREDELCLADPHVCCHRAAQIGGE